MLKVVFSGKMKKDLKLAKKRGYNLDKLAEVMHLLVEEKQLPAKYKDHKLTGEYEGQRECHIEPDWLLIYKIEDNLLILTLTRTGTHSDLF